MVWPHRIALLLSGATLILILFGGLVTDTGAALAVPDWPTTFGYSMFLYPWSQMVGGIFYEHSHRLIGSLVGFLTVVLAVLLWVVEPRRWLKWLGLLAVLVVSVQGLLGGLRVILLRETLAILHGALAQAFFGLTVGLVLFTSKEWAEGARARARSVPGPILRRLAFCITCGLYLQIVFGGLLTHWGRLDWHLGWTLGLLILIPVFGTQILRRYGDHPDLTGPAIGMQVLFVVQLLLGVGSYVARFTSVALPLASFTVVAFPVVHRLTGALLLGVSLVLTLRLYHLSAMARGSSALLPGGSRFEMKGLPA